MEQTLKTKCRLVLRDQLRQIKRVHTFRTKSPPKRIPLSEYPYWTKFNVLFFFFSFFFFLPNIRTVRHTGSVFSFRVPASQSLLRLQKKNMFVFFVKTLHIVKSSKKYKNGSYISFIRKAGPPICNSSSETRKHPQCVEAEGERLQTPTLPGR